MTGRCRVIGAGLLLCVVLAPALAHAGGGPGGGGGAAPVGVPAPAPAVFAATQLLLGVLAWLWARRR